MEEVYLNERGASERVALAVSTLQKMRVTGTGPRFCKIGKAVRYRLSDLNAYMASKVVLSTSDELAA